jgi:hypothetical protein
MSRTLRCVALASGLGLLLAASGSPTRAQAKKAKKGPAVELTDKAGKWGLWLVGPRTKILEDRDYTMTTVPKEMGGATFVARTSGEYGRWLPDGALKAKGPVTAYAMVRTKYIGKDTFDEDKQQKLVKDGWAEVEGKVGTTSPGKEGWEWKAFKKDLDAGEISLPLKNLSWEKHGTAVLFLFKEREAGKK